MRLPVVLLALCSFGAAPAGAISFSDDFGGGLDPFFWGINTGPDNTVEWVAGRVVFTQGSSMGASGVSFLHTLTGDFTMTADFELIVWPPDNEQVISIGGPLGVTERTSKPVLGGEVYSVNLSPSGGPLTASAPTVETSGTLRFRRSGTVLCGDFWDGAAFVEIDCHDAGAAPDTNVGFGSFNQEASGAGVQVAFDNLSVDAPGTSICGDGVVELAEECDDGNTVSGDLCDAACLIETVCPVAPLVACVPAGKASLKVVEKKAGKEKLKATLKKLADPTTPADFGDPVAGDTRYDLCIYDDGGALAGELSVDRSGETCGAKQKPCWKTKGARGFAYKDPDAASFGVKKASLASGDAGKGKLQFAAGNNAKKSQTAMPTGIVAALQNASGAVVQVQLTGGTCFEAALGTVKRADGIQFKASGSGPVAE